mgnify:CR=1 FL=1
MRSQPDNAPQSKGDDGGDEMPWMVNRLMISHRLFKLAVSFTFSCVWHFIHHDLTRGQTIEKV